MASARLMAVGLATLFAVKPVLSQEPILGEASITQSIQCGLREIKCDRPILFQPGMGFLTAGIWTLEVITPAGQVYSAALAAKEKYLPFTRADVTPGMLAPLLTIRARSAGTDMKWHPEVTHIVILPKGKKDGAIQPVSIEDWNTEIKNALGASVTRIGKTATFNLA